MSDAVEKPFTELFRKSGLMEKHLPEFKRWRLVNEEDPEAKKPEQTLNELVRDIGELLEKERVMQQTRLTPLPVQAPRLWVGLNTNTRFHAIVDEMGNLVVPPGTPVCRGDVYQTDGVPEGGLLVEDVEDLFEGSHVVAKLVKLSK